jgi:hypothetical protein
MNKQVALERVRELYEEARLLRVPNPHEVANEIRALTHAENPALIDYMLRKAWIESRFNPLAINKASYAAGLYQIMWFNLAHEWQDNEDFNPFHAEDNIAWTLEFTAGNANSLKQAGFPITMGRLYLAHQQGAGGAGAILRGAKNGLTIEQLPNSIERNVRANIPGGTRVTTCAEFEKLWERRMATAQIPEGNGLAALDNENDEDDTNMA